MNTKVSLIKFIAATMVILFHSYPLTGGGMDFISYIFNGKISMGGVAVSTFFVFSGFYLTGSLEKDDRPIPYIRKRMNKIMPPLITVILGTIVIIGPLFTEWNIFDYFTDIGTYKYLLNILFIPVHFLPGVFLHAPYNPTVNGSLWTLPVEVGCYIFLLILMLISKKSRFWEYVLAGFVILLGPLIRQCFVENGGTLLASALLPFFMFCMGHFMWNYKKKNVFSSWMCIWGLLFIMISTRVPVNIVFVYMFVLFFPYILITITQSDKFTIKGGMWEKLSYDMYLWAFPIGQIIVELKDGIQVLEHFIYTWIIVLIIALVLNFIREKKCYKRGVK